MCMIYSESLSLILLGGLRKGLLSEATSFFGRVSAAILYIKTQWFFLYVCSELIEELTGATDLKLKTLWNCHVSLPLRTAGY